MFAFRETLVEILRSVILFNFKMYPSHKSGELTEIEGLMPRLFVRKTPPNAGWINHGRDATDLWWRRFAKFFQQRDLRFDPQTRTGRHGQITIYRTKRIGHDILFPESVA